VALWPEARSVFIESAAFTVQQGRSTSASSASQTQLAAAAAPISGWLDTRFGGFAATGPGGQLALGTESQNSVLVCTASIIPWVRHPWRWPGCEERCPAKLGGVDEPRHAPHGLGKACRPDECSYDKGTKISDAEMAALNISGMH
jgi:hypothetical protein